MKQPPPNECPECGSAVQIEKFTAGTIVTDRRAECPECGWQWEKGEGRPEWVKCVEKHKGESYCGRTGLSMEWHFVDLEHAESTVRHGGRLVPCEECMAASLVQVTR